MPDTAVMAEWLSFAVRWLHVVTGIAWIGSSFYFIALDLGLRRDGPLAPGVNGEAWQVHGGGFYSIQKYLVAPDALPEHLTWFKWEAYSTWLSGFALLAIVYYAGADLFLVDPTVLDLDPWTAIALSLATIGVGWIGYDLLCRSPLGRSDTGLMLLLYAGLVAAAWGYTQVFSGRAALLHLGVITATAMSANVFFVIIPNQKKVVAALLAGQEPDPALGRQAKQRSLHNNYLTLPVLFLMLSNHYPLAFATEYNWVIASLVFIMGVVIRHFFNSHHAGKGNPLWTWAVAGILLIIIMWLSSAGPTPEPEDEARAMPPAMVETAEFEAARDIVLGRCSMCHAAEPAWDGIHVAPKHVRLENDAQIVRHAEAIYLQAGISRAMPPGNITFITTEERRQLAAWFKATGTGSAANQ